jgi:MFS family permease
VQQQLGGSRAMIGVYLAVMTGTSLLSTAVIGRISRRIPARKIMYAAVIAGGLMSVLVLLLAIVAEPLQITSEVASYWLIPVFALSAIRITGAGIAGNSMLFDVAPLDNRSLYIGFTNTWIGLVLLATGIGGVVVQVFGFEALVAFTIAAHLIALIFIQKISVHK